MIPIAEPNLTGKEKEYVTDAIASGWVSGGGPYVERFEAMVAEECGKRHCIATITGTAALHAAMRALNFSGRIKVPSRTFSASRNVIRLIGGEPSTYYDITEPINHDRAELYEEDNGDPRVIVDAAPAVGILERVNATAWTLSFNGNKTVTTGQGGAILCDDPQLAEALRIIIRQRQYGGEFNYRMSNLNAAMGCAQMERLEEFLERKQGIWNRYVDAEIPLTQAGPSRWMCVVNERSRRPGQEMPFETKYLWGTEYWCLPCSTNLTREDQDKVIRCVESLQ